MLMIKRRDMTVIFNVYFSVGDLVPDNVMVGLVASELKKLGEKPWLLDGFPRTQPQVSILLYNTIQKRKCFYKMNIA